MKQVIEIYKHPYMWKAEFTFGTLEEMIKNRDFASVDGYGYDDDGFCSSIFHLYFGGSFNKKFNNTSRAALVQLGVEISVNKKATYWKEVDIADITSVKCIQTCHWEGTYAYHEKLDEFIKQGLYPVNVDWNGVTYIEDGYFDKNRRYQTRYKETDTYRY